MQMGGEWHAYMLVNADGYAGSINDTDDNMETMDVYITQNVLKKTMHANAVGRMG